MSRVYFNSPSESAELRGPELYWLRHLAYGPAKAAWDLDDETSPTSFELACGIVAMTPEVPDNGMGENFLHDYMRAAQRPQLDGSDQATRRAGIELRRRFLQSFKTRLSLQGLRLDVHGVGLHTNNVDLNTALVAGADAVALAAKIHGYVDKHAWVEGADRAWLADVIEQGLSSGLYRRNLGWEGPCEQCYGPGVVPFLRARDDEPVVLSFSGSESFPNPMVGDWMPPWPEGVERDWNALTSDQQHERHEREEQWCALPDERRWEISLAGLRVERSWARLSAELLRGQTFSYPVTVYDLTASDRDERLRAVLAEHPDYREPVSAPTS